MIASVALALLLAPSAATPTPAPKTPTPVPITEGGRAASPAPVDKLGVSATPVPGRRSLSDFAREAKERQRKGTGTVSTYGGSAATKVESEAAGQAAAELPSTAALKPGKIVLQGISREGGAGFSGTLKNTGDPACQVNLTVQAMDDHALVIGASTVVVAGPVPTGSEVSFEGSVRVPVGTISPEESNLNDGRMGEHVKELGMKVLASFRAQVASASSCR